MPVNKPLSELTPSWRKKKIAMQAYQEKYGPPRKAYMEKIREELRSYERKKKPDVIGMHDYPFDAFPEVQE